MYERKNFILCYMGVIKIPEAGAIIRTFMVTAFIGF